MLVMLCSLWPVLLAATIGWMACAAFAWQVVGRSAPAVGVFKRINVIVLALLSALLLLLWLMDYGPRGAQCTWSVRRAVAAEQHPREEILPPRRATANAVAATLAASPPGAGPAASKAAAAGPAPVKLYFALARADLPADAGGRLASTLSHLKANPEAQARLSGFYDASGDAAKNEALAYRRARAVRQWLIDGGIAGERLLMNKPASAAAHGPPEEARRVEVALRP
jgi:outer membrane protein OmpA-like peptidoglycan-associated protein